MSRNKNNSRNDNRKNSQDDYLFELKLAGKPSKKFKSGYDMWEWASRENSRIKFGLQEQENKKKAATPTPAEE